MTPISPSFTSKPNLGRPTAACASVVCPIARAGCWSAVVSGAFRRDPHASSSSFRRAVLAAAFPVPPVSGVRAVEGRDRFPSRESARAVQTDRPGSHQRAESKNTRGRRLADVVVASRRPAVWRFESKAPNPPETGQRPGVGIDVATQR